MPLLAAEIIKKTRNGETLSSAELEEFIAAFVQGQLPDYQMAAWLMAVYFRGLSPDETVTLTHLMKNSGDTMKFTDLKRPRVDKHSTGGVGDKISLILAPLVAACGVTVPMVAGRGLGHTGGTLDKLESIPGFRVGLSIEEFSKNVRTHGFSIMGQTLKLCPADRKMYALRDVTATVESLSLICASIMSKKLAEDLTGLVLDVKWGSGAFMKSQAAAERLARALAQIGEASGVQVTALVTRMAEPLGAYIGNALEVKECVEIMRGESKSNGQGDLYADTRELTLQLAAHMVLLGGNAKSEDDAYKMATEKLRSGEALKFFDKMCAFQGPSDYTKLPETSHRHVIKAERDGYFHILNCEKIGIAALTLGAGRIAASDTVDFTAGIEMHFKEGHRVRKGDALMTLYSASPENFKAAETLLRENVSLKTNAGSPQPLISSVLYGKDLR